MKTKKKLFGISSAIILALGLTILVTSCDNSQKNTNAESSEKVKKIRPPEMDIHTAALLGNIDAIKQHIEAGTPLNEKEPLGGSTPLITASVFGRTDVAKALIEAGADLNAKNNDGSTALHCAALFCYPEIVVDLLEHGADKNLTNNRGELAYMAVEIPFSEMKPAYDFFAQQLGPLGLKLDYKHLEETRPIIAKMLN